MISTTRTPPASMLRGLPRNAAEPACTPRPAPDGAVPSPAPPVDPCRLLWARDAIARTRSYLIGIHRVDDDTYHHADGGGWYDCTLRRTPEGWRFATVRIHEVWHAGSRLPHVEQVGSSA
jgi:hypothetical protein